MNKKKKKLLTLAIISVIGVVFLCAPIHTGIKTISLSTNKTVYHLGEDMQINLTINSYDKMDNLFIRVYGLKGRNKNDLVSFLRTKNMTAGENNITFHYKIPSCGCAVALGKHYILADVTYDKEKMSRIKEIDLKK